MAGVSCHECVVFIMGRGHREQVSLLRDLVAEAVTIGDGVLFVVILKSEVKRFLEVEVGVEVWTIAVVDVLQADALHGEDVIGFAVVVLHGCCDCGELMVEKSCRRRSRVMIWLIGWQHLMRSRLA